jgi:hypothetical protein
MAVGAFGSENVGRPLDFGRPKLQMSDVRNISDVRNVLDECQVVASDTGTGRPAGFGRPTCRTSEGRRKSVQLWEAY